RDSSARPMVLCRKQPPSPTPRRTGERTCAISHSLCEHGPAQTHLSDQPGCAGNDIGSLGRPEGQRTPFVRPGSCYNRGSRLRASRRKPDQGPCQTQGGTAMQITRRNFLATGAGAITAAAAAPAFAAWEESTRYPDPRIQILDPSFARYRIAQSSVQRLYTGARWGEGPVWMADWRCILWSDIPNNRILRWDEVTGR